MNHPAGSGAPGVRNPFIAMVILAATAFAACGGTPAPSLRPTPAPGATSAPSGTSAAAVDPCLVGTWTTVAENQTSPANDENITYSGGAGEVFTIAANGEVTIDTHAATRVDFHDSAGEAFSATVSGTGRGTLSTASYGTMKVFDFKPSADDTRKTLSLDSTGSELGPARPDTEFSAVYTCVPGRFTFYKQQVGYMIDGPIVTLVAGDDTPSSTGSLRPS